MIRLKYLKSKCSNHKMFPLNHINLKTTHKEKQIPNFYEEKESEGTDEINDDDIDNQSISFIDLGD